MMHLNYNSQEAPQWDFWIEHFQVLAKNILIFGCLGVFVCFNEKSKYITETKFFMNRVCFSWKTNSLLKQLWWKIFDQPEWQHCVAWIAQDSFFSVPAFSVFNITYWARFNGSYWFVFPKSLNKNPDLVHPISISSSNPSINQNAFHRNPFLR